MKQIVYNDGPPKVLIGPKRAIVIERGKPSPPLADELADQLITRAFPVFTVVPDKVQAKTPPVKGAPLPSAPTSTTQEG